MTHQCLNCGSQTRAGAKFCHLCGTPIATTSLPPTMPLGTAAQTSAQTAPPPAASRTAAATEAMPAPTAYISQTPQTYHKPHPMPTQPPKKSGHTFKVILITLLVLVALGLGAVATGVFLVRKGVERATRNGMNFPIGDVRVSTKKEDINEETLGVPLYPGAQSETPFVIRGNNEKGSGSFGTFTFTTTDDVDEVVDFYKEKLGENTRVSDVTGQGNRVVTLSLIENNANKTIVVTAADDKTKIVVTSILGKPGRNRDEERRFEQQMRDQAERIQREIERGLPPPPGVPPPPPGAPAPRNFAPPPNR